MSCTSRDLHLRAGQERKLAFVRSLAELEPDLVVNTGDNITEPGAIAPLLAAMDGLRSLPGVFVFGSNDYYAPRSGNPLKYLIRRRRPGSPTTPTAGTSCPGISSATGWRAAAGRT